MIKITPELGEFVGIFIGDGFTNRYGNHYIVEFTGNSRKEREYFENNLIPLVDRIFESKPHVRIVKGAIRLRYNSKQMFNEMVGLGLVSGKKSAKVRIPEIFLKRDDVTRSVVRGIMDTDGCVVWDMRSIYRRPYPRISLTTISRPLAFQVRRILEDMGFSVYFKEYYRKGIKNKNYHVDLYGPEQLDKWNKRIGFSNPKNVIKSVMPQ